MAVERSRTENEAKGRPWSSNSPPKAGCTPANVRNNVDLPTPFPPNRQTSSPARKMKSSERCTTAVRFPLR